MNIKFPIWVMILAPLAIVLGLYSCASTGAPTGGPRDTRPPVLDSILSAKNRQTNFLPRKLEFFFDEFVEVKDAIKQVLVSPPLTYIPQVKHRGKKVTFEFNEKEVLRENATYTINFGKSVVDFHEGNELGNFTFVFATGPVLDSLNLKGTIKNAVTQEPETEMVVFLYDKTNDSIVAKEKPFYFARLDKEGKFEFNNIKSDTFKLFAIKDENLNYLYDLDTEKIAYPDSLIYLDSAFSTTFSLFASTPTPKIKLLASNSKTFGKINLQYNTPPIDIKYTVSDSTIKTFPEMVVDSLNVYYNVDRDSFFIYALDDTIKVKPKGKSEFIKKSKLKRIYTNNSVQMLPKDSLVMGFNQPLDSVDFTNILISDTIGFLEGVQFSMSESKKEIVIKYPWAMGESYDVVVDSAILRSIYGMANDSIGFSFRILNTDQTAALHAKIVDLDSTKTYFIKLLRDKTDVYSVQVSGVSNTSIKLAGLVPERYNIEIIEDDNKNKKWDPANYWNKTQSEKFKLIKGDKIRANWESEYTASWKTGTISGGEPAPEETKSKNKKGR